MKGRKEKTASTNINSYSWLLLGLILFVVFITYSKVLNFEFVWDDKPLYLREERLSQNFNLLELFIPQKNRMYIPMTMLIWKIVGEIGGFENGHFNPFPYHLLNLVLHIFNSIIVFLIIRKILQDDLLSLMGVILFSLHPIQVESVAWISEGRGLLSAFFGLLAILFRIYFQDKKRNDIWVIVFLIFSMLSKPSGVVFPLILIAFNFFYQKEINFKIFLENNWQYVVLLLPFVYLAVYGESTKMIDFAPPIWSRPILFLNSLGFYLYKLLIPIDFSPGYGLTPKFLFSNPQFLTFIVFGILTVVTIFFVKNKIYRISLVLFIFGFLPVSNLIPYYYQYWSTVADRYVYVSMLGVSIFLPYLFKRIGNFKKIITIILAGLILSILTGGELEKWENDFALWSNCIEKYPNRIPHPYLGRGLFFQEKGEFNRAMNDFTKCLEIDSSYLFAYYNRGNIFFDSKKYDLAVLDYSRAIEINPKYVNALVNRGIAFMELSKYSEANRDFTSAIKIDSNQMDAIYYRGFSYLKLAKFDSALADFERYYLYNPNDKEIFNLILNLKREKSKESK